MRVALVGLVMAATLALVGCGTGSSNEDVGQGMDVTAGDVAGETAVPTDTGAKDMGDVAPVVAKCPGMPNLTGMFYRVNHMEATKPIDDLNEVWDIEIKKYWLVLIFHIIEHDEEKGTLLVEVGPAKAEAEQLADGSWDPKEFRYIEGANVPTVVMQLDGCDFTFDDPIALDVLTPSVSIPFPVSVTSGSGRFIKKGLAMEKVDLVGYIVEAATYDLCMTMDPFGQPNVHWLFNLLHLCPDLDLDGDDKLDAYEFEGWLSTEITDLVVPDETVILPSEVDECIEDQVECEP